MTDSTISRLRGTDFTPPRPITLGERPSAPVKRVEKFTPVSHEIFDAMSAPQAVPEAHAPIHEPEACSDAPAAAAAASPRPVQASEAKFSLRKRIAFLIAAIAVPAMAAPGQIGSIPGAAPTEAETLAALTTKPTMPFERAGMSFPGSAFFYVDEASEEEGLVALPASDPLQFGGEFGRDIGSLIDAGPAAAAFFVAGSSLSQSRAQRCLAEAIWYEAGTESEAGQRAVAQVVLNRVAHPSWPSSVCGVVYEGSERATGCQFSFTCDGSLARKTSGASWKRAQEIAAEALSGKTYAPIGLATHYHARWIEPYWASSLRPVGTIGAHQFYRAAGKAGEKSAFTGTYSGIEPSVSGRIPQAPPSGPSRSASAPLPSFPRIASPRRAGGAAPAASQQAPRPAAVAPAQSVPPAGSALANPGLRSSGQVKEQYSNAGQWKQKPASEASSPASTGAAPRN